MKVVINKSYGGFGLSPKALEWLYSKHETDCVELTPINQYFSTQNEIDEVVEYWKQYKKTGKVEELRYCYLALTPDLLFVITLANRYDNKLRSSKMLIKCVEELGEEANREYAELKIVNIPDGVDFEIHEYGGKESIHEVHQSWG